MEKFKNKYRVKSARLDGYDYSQDGIYFVTICVNNREHSFGEIRNGAMILNSVGEIVKDEWLKTAELRPYVIIDEWAIMPNHFHAILIINKEKKYTPTPVETPRWGVSHRDVSLGIGDVSHRDIPNQIILKPETDIPTKILYNSKTFETPQTLKTPQRGVSTSLSSAGGWKREWRVDCLGSILNQFKGQCTKIIHKGNNPNFSWQARFYDHLIRDGRSLQKIRNYIINNPDNWELDRNNLENLWM